MRGAAAEAAGAAGKAAQGECKGSGALLPRQLLWMPRFLKQDRGVIEILVEVVRMPTPDEEKGECVDDETVFAGGEMCVVGGAGGGCPCFLKQDLDMIQSVAYQRVWDTHCRLSAKRCSWHWASCRKPSFLHAPRRPQIMS